MAKSYTNVFLVPGTHGDIVLESDGTYTAYSHDPSAPLDLRYIEPGLPSKAKNNKKNRRAKIGIGIKTKSEAEAAVKEADALMILDTDTALQAWKKYESFDLIVIRYNGTHKISPELREIRSKRLEEIQQLQI